MEYPLEIVVATARTLSPFYRRLYQEVPLTGWSLSDLPVVDQQAFWRANCTGRANEVLTGPITGGIIFHSGGTTGAPKLSVYSTEEWRTFTAAFGRGLAANELQDGDRVVNLFFAVDMYASFLFLSGAMEKGPIELLNIPLTGAAAHATIYNALRELGANALIGAPTTLINFAEYVAKQPEGELRVEKLLYGGEAMYPDQMDFLQRVFPGAKVRSVGYASVDAGLLGYQDKGCRAAEHRVFSRETVVELLDEDTGEVIEEVGRPGKVVVTSLFRLLTPILRYPAGDRAEWVEPSGAADRKFRLLGRSQEGGRVGTCSVHVDDVVSVLSAFAKPLGMSNFQMVFTHQDRRDALTLRIVASAGPEALARATEEIVEAFHAARPLFLAQKLANRIHPLTVEWVQSGQLELNARTGKLKRVIDRRLEPGASAASAGKPAP